MRVPLNRTTVLRIAIVGIFVFGVLFAFREAAIRETPLPVEVFHKVRNLSAQEREWNIATVAQPGDVIEHFVLIHAPDANVSELPRVRLSIDSTSGEVYRPDTLESASRGIGSENAGEYEQRLFGKTGMTLARIAPGEFMDLRWQSKVSDDVAFDQKSAPLIESEISVNAPSYSSLVSKTLISLFSTIERPRAIVRKTIEYDPIVLGMNTRRTYEDIGAGVVIAGQDFGGISNVRIAESKKQLAWRIESDEVIEASIPAGLTPGDHTIEFLDDKNNTLAKTLVFSVLPSKDRAVVVQATPDIIESGTRRTIVLQGIRLSPDVHIQLRDQSKGKLFALENQNQINDRVLSADVPESAASGSYTIFVNDREQEARLRIN